MFVEAAANEKRARGPQPLPGGRTKSTPKEETSMDLAIEQLTNVLTAISHPTRRAIIKQLSRGPARFLDVARPFDTALNSVTKHLKLLERAGLITRRKQGREVFISFQAEPLQHVATWVHEYERFWNEHLDQFQQFFRDKTITTKDKATKR